MRLDLFLLGATQYRVAIADAALLLEILQAGNFMPKALKRYKKSTEIRFCLTRKHAQAFERLAQSRGLHFRCEEKGVRVLARKMLHAPGLLAGVLLSAVLFVGMRTVVWDIRITGMDKLDVETIEQALAECGLVRGTFLPTLDADELALSLRQKESRIGYAAVNIQGMVAHVQIRENQPVPVPNAKNPANLVAACDGVITMPLIFEGECLVQPGDVVRAGQILAGGMIDTQNHGYRTTRAAGQVLARTVHTYTVHVPFVYEEKVYTGEKTRTVSLLLFHSAQKVFENVDQNTDKCDIIEEISWLRTPAGALLPFGYHSIIGLAYEMQTRTRTLQTARSVALAELQERLAAESVSRTLLEKNMEWCVDGEGVTLFCTVVCEEDIARTQEFVIQS